MKTTIEYDGKQVSLKNFLSQEFKKPITNSLLLMFINNIKEKLTLVLGENGAQRTDRN